MSLFDADLVEGMIRDTADAVVRYDGVVTWAQLDEEDVREVGGGGGQVSVIGTNRSLLVATGKLPGLALDQTIEVDKSAEALDTGTITAAAITYIIRDLGQEGGDGLETRIYLLDS